MLRVQGGVLGRKGGEGGKPFDVCYNGLGGTGPSTRRGIRTTDAVSAFATPSALAMRCW